MGHTLLKSSYSESGPNVSSVSVEPYISENFLITSSAFGASFPFDL